MVGRGQRFRDEGFTTPKQLIEVGHKQIIDWSLSCIKTDDCNLIFVIRKDTVYSHQMDKVLRQKFGDEITIIIVDRETEGTVCSCLYAEDYIDNEIPLVITTLDMYFEPHFNPADVDVNVDGAVDLDLGGTSNLNFGADSGGVHMYVGSNQFFSNIC